MDKVEEAKKFEEELGKMTQEAHERRIQIIKDTFDDLIQDARDIGDSAEVRRLSMMKGSELRNALNLWNSYKGTDAS